MMNGSNVQVLYGTEGIKSVYQACLSAKKVDFMCTSTRYEAVLGDWYDKEFAPKLFAGATKTREILTDSQENRDYALTKPAKNQVRFVNEQYASETDVVLWDDMAALVAFDAQQPMVLMIADGEVAKALHNMFEVLWKKLAL